MTVVARLAKSGARIRTCQFRFGLGGLPRHLPRLLCPLIVAALVLSPSGVLAQSDESDDLIYDRVIRSLVNDPQLKANSLEVEVKDRVVTVTGYVRTEKLRRRVEKVVKKTKGVKKVVNQVEVRS